MPAEAVVIAIEEALLAAMRGEPVTAAHAGPMLDWAVDQGVAALVSPPATAAWPDDVRARLRRIRREQIVASIARTRQARRVFDALGAAGIPAIAIKGAHVAHAIYADAGQRPCSDTDLLIRAADRDRTAAVLEGCGYRRPVHVRGRVILGQFHFELPASEGPGLPLDVHWRVAAPLVIGAAVDVDAVIARAVPLPALGAAARGPAPADALVIACVHLIAHHATWPRLIWLYDLHRLAAAAPPIEEDALLDASCGVRAICARALRTADTSFPHGRLDALASLLERHAGREPSAVLLRPRHPLLDLWQDVRAGVPWSVRWTLLKEHLCPGAGYMRRAGYRAPLPLAYATRAAAGVRRLIIAGDR